MTVGRKDPRGKVGVRVRPLSFVSDPYEFISGAYRRNCSGD